MEYASLDHGVEWLGNLDREAGEIPARPPPL